VVQSPKSPAAEPAHPGETRDFRQHAGVAAHYQCGTVAGSDACGPLPAPAGEGAHLQSGRGAVRESDREWLRSVWEELAPELARLASAMGMDPSRAEDVLQDVYLAAWQHAPRETDRIGLGRWLYRVTVNRCNLEHRRRTRRRRVLGRLARLAARSRPSDEATDAAARQEAREVVRRALGRLEPGLRAVLVLRYFAELDSKEIGHILGLPGSTVRSRLRTARRKLAWELKRTGYADA
jgi:RNA polymerase sigma-70 factor (ECF subfamily)